MTRGVEGEKDDRWGEKTGREKTLEDKSKVITWGGLRSNISLY